MFVLGVFEEFLVDVGAFPLEEGFLFEFGLVELLFKKSDFFLVAKIEFIEGFLKLKIVVSKLSEFGVLFWWVFVGIWWVVH